MLATEGSGKLIATFNMLCMLVVRAVLSPDSNEQGRTLCQLGPNEKVGPAAPMSVGEDRLRHLVTADRSVSRLLMRWSRC